ncbi:hypothetical protein, partial [Streptococcus pneumoniae]|uniref:hypothetical protein n=1 Tax=Streptococcus pneumoniae TaxID=1313 RepID=UPI001D100EE5
LLSKIGLTTTLKNAWTTSRQVNFFWVANFNLKFGKTVSSQKNKKTATNPLQSQGLCVILLWCCKLQP